MDGAGLDEQAITAAARKAAAAGCTGALIGCRFQHLAIDIRFQSRVNLAAGECRENDPSFGLSPIGRIELRGLFVVGMHLYGKRSLTIQVFEQQGKPMLWKMLPQKIAAVN